MNIPYIVYFVHTGQQVDGPCRKVTTRSRNYSIFVYTILSVSKTRNLQKHILGITTKQDTPRPWVEDNISQLIKTKFVTGDPLQGQ